MPMEHAWTIKLDYDDASIPILLSKPLKTCLGYAKSQRRRCRNPISWAMYDGINAIIRDLVDGACQSTSKLAELAERLLCKHSHRNQASNLEKALSKAFDHFTRKSSPTPISPISVIVPFPDTPLPSLVSFIQYPSPASASTILEKTLKTHFPPHHSTTMNAKQIEKRVGDVYMFRYRDSDPNGPIKIGFSKNVQTRMRSIQRKCKMDPVIISDPKQRRIKYAYKAEQIVFAVLHNQRRQIQRCPGCRTTHIEWFEIDEASAMQVIEKVRQFMEDLYGSVFPQPDLQGRADLGQSRAQSRAEELRHMAKQLEQRGRIPEPVAKGRKLESIPSDLQESHKAPRPSGTATERHRDRVPYDKPPSCSGASSDSQEARCSEKRLQGQQDTVSSRHTRHKHPVTLRPKSSRATRTSPPCPSSPSSSSRASSTRTSTGRSSPTRTTASSGPDGLPIQIKSIVPKAPRGQLVAVLDSGFTLPQVPRSVSDAIYGRVQGAVYDTQAQYWTVPCGQYLNIAFNFGGVTYPIHPLDTVNNDFAYRDSNGNPACIGAFQPITSAFSLLGNYDMILGMGFLRNTSTLLDFGNWIGSSNDRGDPYVQLLFVTDVNAAKADFIATRLNGVDTTGSAQYALLPADQMQHSPVSAAEKKAMYQEMILSPWSYIFLGCAVSLVLVVGYTTMYSLAGVYKSQGRYDDAEVLLKKVLASEEKQLGSEHVSTLTTMNRLAVLYASQQRYMDAKKLLVHTLAHRTRLLGPSHPHTQNTASTLAYVNDELRRSDVGNVNHRAGQST